MRGSSQKKWLCRAVTSRPLSSSADMTGLTSSCVSTRSPMRTSMPVPLVIATQPPKPNGVGVLTLATVTARSLRGMFTLRTFALKSPVLPSVVSTCWYSAGMSCADAVAAAAERISVERMSKRFMMAVLLLHLSLENSRTVKDSIMFDRHRVVDRLGERRRAVGRPGRAIVDLHAVRAGARTVRREQLLAQGRCRCLDLHRTGGARDGPEPDADGDSGDRRRARHGTQAVDRDAQVAAALCVHNRERLVIGAERLQRAGERFRLLNRIGLAGAAAAARKQDGQEQRRTSAHR